ncbi:hypothetical protein MMC18_001911 [Xylographa bjoerkii]|nr:hypothetical protein [Xylographa bjoerkii]
MTGLSTEAPEAAAAVPDMVASDPVANGTVRRSSRAHTGRSSLNVEDLVRTAGIPESDVAKRKRAPVSRKIPLEHRGISKESSAKRTGRLNVEKDELKELVPEYVHAHELALKISRPSAAGTKRTNGLAKTEVPAKRRRVSASTENVSSLGLPSTTGAEGAEALRDANYQPSAPTDAHVNAAVVPIATSSTVAGTQRPKPYGAPLVWAEGRQALCETLPYYRAYNSGAHTSGGLAHGFLLSSDNTERSFMDDEVVITRAGGHCGRNEAGEMAQVSDHSADDARIASFRNNISCQYPLVLIVGKQNTDCPTEIPHEFCVMDWFHVTDIWAEKNQGKVCFKFRFEKLDRKTKSWWAQKDSPDVGNSSILPPRAFRGSCNDCHESSTRIFEQAWICLNEKCPAFWKLHGKDINVQLTYNRHFLNERTVWPEDNKPPYNIVPQLPQPNAADEASIGYNRACWKGIVCRRCGRCTSRRHWDAWRCETENCGFVYTIPQPILSPRAVSDAHDVPFTGHAIPRDQIIAPVTMRPPQFDGAWRVHTYDLCPGNTVTHFHASETVNTLQGSANDLFKALQTNNCMGLQRFPMKMHTGKGEVLAQHFALNYGMPYKYVVAVDSKGFSEAPPPIIHALKGLEWAAHKSVQDKTFKAFNELLAVGYFEDGKMGFHDDGEKELGPTVATLSLGGNAVMTLRMKGRYFTGLTKGGAYDHKEPVLPGSFLETERRSLNTLHSRVSESKFDAMRKTVYSTSKHRTPRNGPPILTMHLSHGDIVIMHGAEMQKYYEHQIVSSGKMRFGLTCRYIKPELVDEAHHWKGVHETPVTPENVPGPVDENQIVPAMQTAPVSHVGETANASTVAEIAPIIRAPHETEFPVFF